MPTEKQEDPVHDARGNGTECQSITLSGWD